MLLQSFCGLRPSEALELRRRRLDLDATPPKVSFAGSYNPLPERYLQPGETRRRPLGRPRETGHPHHPIPIPSKVAAQNTVSGEIVFDVPQGRQVVEAELHDSAFSGGVLVDLQ